MNRSMTVLHWLCRITLAVVFIYSGYVKVNATLQFMVAITGYKIVPESLIYYIAQYFPWIEIALGVLILTGIKIRWSAIAASGLMLFFIGLLSITLLRGIETNCGCFGFGEKITWLTLIRDGSILIPALYLVFEPMFRKKRAKESSLPSTSAVDSPV